MASQVGIINAALTKIGAKQSVVSLEDGTPAANFGAARYEELRDDLLRDHNWNFAIRRVKLARLSEGPTFEYRFRYQLPDRWLRILNAWDNAAGRGHLNYRTEGNMLLTDSSDVWCKFVIQVVDPNEMSADFRECLTLKLAIEAAVKLAGSTQLSQLMEARFERRFTKAVSNDSFDTRPTQLPRGSWITGRFR